MGRIAKSVCDKLRENNYKFGAFIPKTLFPFPYKRLNELSKNTKIFFDIEMNLGQMFKDVQHAISNNAHVAFIGRAAGEWLKQEEIIKTIDKILKEQYATSI